MSYVGPMRTAVSKKDFTALKNRWVLVANRVEAIVYSINSQGRNFKQVVAYEHPEGREKDEGIKSDRPGRVKDSFGRGRHSYSKKVSPAKQRMVDFAHVLCELLRQGRLDGRFDESILICSPILLGTLREVMKSSDAKVLRATFTKDLMRFSPAQRERAVLKLMKEI